MKFDYRQIINTLEGKPFEGAPGVPLQLIQVIEAACSNPIQGDDQLSAIDKYKVGEIAVCAYKGLPLTAGQVDTLKTRIAKMYPNAVLVYLIHEILEHPINEAAALKEKPRK